jgi:hypothetical protein
MNESLPTAAWRRHAADGGLTVLLLALAVAQGYLVLGTPLPLGARPVPGPAAHTERVSAVASPAPTAEPVGLTTAGPSPAQLGVSLSPLPSPEVGRRAEAGARTMSGGEVRGEWPPRVTLRVVDDQGLPAAGASVVAAGREVRTDPDGTTALEGLVADTGVLVKMPGFEKVLVPPGPETTREVRLRPHVVKAAYLTYYGVADRGIRGRVLDLLARTELNAVVIDVKGDRGWIPYRTEVPQALAAGAQGPVILKDFDGLMADLKARGLYTIARIVTFKDNVLAHSRPDLAVIDTRTGRPWIDRENLAWVDPFREEVWAYNIAIAREAVARGFDEIQFDYVRFPTDGKLGAARYARPVSMETRLATIAGFLGRARRELGPLGAFVAADVFGYTAFNENDTDIGQRIEELAPHLDYLCPMVYPSGYHLGIPGFRNPVRYPYEVVRESVRLIRRRAAPHPVKVRPWLQDFRDYAFDRRPFGVAEIRAQIRGSEEAGGVGWMLWNPRNDYTAAALNPKGPLAAR